MSERVEMELEPPPRPSRWRPVREAAFFFGVPLAALAILALLGLMMAPRLLTVSNPPSKADILIILGGETEGRSRTCAELFRKGVARRVIISGAGDSEPIEIQLMSEGVPGTSIFFESKSASTLENASMTVPILRQVNVRSAVIVTSWFHTRRALACFQKVAPEIQFTAAAAPFEWDSPMARRVGIVREYAKLAGYWLRHGVPPWTHQSTSQSGADVVESPR